MEFVFNIYALGSPSPSICGPGFVNHPCEHILHFPRLCGWPSWVLNSLQSLSSVWSRLHRLSAPVLGQSSDGQEIPGCCRYISTRGQGQLCYYRVKMYYGTVKRQLLTGSCISPPFNGNAERSGFDFRWLFSNKQKQA